MKIIYKKTGEISYSDIDYHRIMYEYNIDPVSNPIRKYEFKRPTGLLDRNGVQMYEGESFQYYKHNSYLLPSFKAKIVWIAEYACFGYKPFPEPKSKKPIPFTAHLNLQQNFLDHIEIIGQGIC